MGVSMTLFLFSVLCFIITIIISIANIINSIFIVTIIIIISLLLIRYFCDIFDIQVWMVDRCHRCENEVGLVGYLSPRSNYKNQIFNAWCLK